MADSDTPRPIRCAHLLTRTLLASPALAGLIVAAPAQAQDRIVSACSGVSLPASAVTSILSPVLTGITAPTEAAVNGILNLPLLGLVLPPLDMNVTGLLAQAASGAPIALQVLARDGTVVGPTDQCRATSDSITLDTPAGVAIGGNQITGLGADGAPAFAGTIDAIAFGNNARAELAATGGLALGADSSVTAANGVALGAGSSAARGAQAGYAAVGLAGPQTSVGEVSIGAPGALRQLTNVAAGSAPDDAATVGQVSGVLAQVTALDAATVRYDGAARDRATLAGAAGTTLGNVAAGAVTAGSSEAVNGAQLFATNADVAGATTAITNLDARVTITETRLGDVAAAAANQPVRYADPATPTVPNGGTATDEATLTGASGGPVGLHNVRAGTLAAGSTDAVNGDQLAATNAQVGANSTAITNLSNIIVGSTVTPIQYSDPGTPTVSNGGTLTNDVTLVGRDGAAPVALHNVAGGTVAAGSTDVVNGGQLAEVAATATNSLQYDRDVTGARADTVTLAGGTAGPVTIANVAAGSVAAGSTQAVNGAQLFATARVAQQAAAQSANSVQYDAGGGAVTFANAAGGAVVLRNVAAGTAATDAANVGQLQAGMQSAVALANRYTDERLRAVSFDLRRARRAAAAGTSAALAAAGLPQPTEAGRSMIAMGGGTYGGRTAVALGASTFLQDGHSILRIGATYDSRGKGGANAGYGYQF